MGRVQGGVATRGRARAQAWAVALTSAVLLAGTPGAARASVEPPREFPTELPDRPQAFRGEGAGCELPDPTGSDGCVTAATAHLLDAVEEAFGELPVSCWDEHAWNPSSDHPHGRACDYTFGELGEFPDEEATERGWLLASWLRENARRLDVGYVIWQGEIWVRGEDEPRAYGGGGIYDVEDPTGGHHDHIHVSLRR